MTKVNAVKCFLILDGCKMFFQLCQVGGLKLFLDRIDFVGPQFGSGVNHLYLSLAKVAKSCNHVHLSLAKLQKAAIISIYSQQRCYNFLNYLDIQLANLISVFF